MPSRNATLPDIEESVSRPIIYDILKQVFEITNLSSDTKILFAGKRGTLQTPGTSIDEASGQDSKDARFQGKKYTYVEVVESYDKSAIQEVSAHAFDHAPIYIDHELRASIRPIYLTSDVTIQIRYQSTSEVEVRQWMAAQYARASRGRDINLHLIRYTYPLPGVFHELITDIWTLREAQDGYGDSLDEYMRKTCTSKLTAVGTRAGEPKAYAIQQNQTRILGNFDFVGVPEKPEWDKETATWTISFGYTFSYQRPDLLFLDYPVAVHSQFLPVRWQVFHENEWDTVNPNNTNSETYRALDQFNEETQGYRIRKPMPLLRIPNFDDVVLDPPPPAFGTVFTALCFLEEDKRNLLDLNDLDTHLIDADVLEFIKSEAPYLTKLHHSFFNVALYRNQSIVSSDIIEVTPEGIVRGTKTLNRRLSLRIRLSLCIDLKFLLKSALDRLALYPKAFVKVISAINEMIASNPDFKDLANVQYVKDWQLTGIYQVLTGGYLMMHNDTPAKREILFNGGNIPEKGLTIENQWLNHLTEEEILGHYREKRLRPMTVMTTAILVVKES